jgi:very-short-patch-repair endonuclease
LERDGIDSAGADEFVALAVSGRTAAPSPDGARSAEESFLFQRLDTMAATAGRFELNGLLDVGRGRRRLEVDLLARQERIAVEIDGYFHFRDAEAFRRDRRKDEALQEAGFLVLRFLADDVVPRLEEILDRIVAAVRRRQGRE